MKNNYFLLLLLFIVAFLRAQNVEPEDLKWVPSSTIAAMVIKDNTVYIGGSFTSIGRNTPYGSQLDITTAAPDLSFARPNSSVTYSISDGAGGWYIGGNFTNVGGQPRNYLARINSDGTLNPWNPNVNSTVSTMVIVNNTLYVGGSFSVVSGQTRSRLAAFDLTTGNLTPWNPAPNSQVESLATDGNTLYAGGYFTSIDEQNRNRLAAFDITTGALTSWNPDADIAVTNLAVANNIVYAGGYFTAIGGQARNYIAAIDSSTGIPTSWAPSLNLYGYVETIAISNSTIYIGGSFNTINGQTRNYLASIDTTTGTLNPWNPNANSTIQVLTVDGNIVYAGGGFTTIGGQTRNYLASIDGTTGTLNPWNASTNSTVQSIAIQGSKMYAGGNFTVMGAIPRRYLAALDAITGEPTSWNPDPNSSVTALALNGNTLYAGGAFANFAAGSQVRNRLAAFDITTGNLTSYDGNITNGAVQAIVISNNTLYAGGTFTSVAGQIRNRLAAIDAATGALKTWNPNANSTVTTLNIKDNLIYAGGAFTTVGGQTRRYIAALDATTGLATSWNPIASNTVQRISIKDNVIFAGGSFTSIGGQSRQYLAALDVTTGLATAWNPAPNNTVTRMSVIGNTLYVGGNFTTIGGLSRTRLAALNTATGVPTSWNPTTLSSTANIFAINAGKLYVGGAFTDINGNPRRAFAVFDNAAPCTIVATTTQTNACYAQSNGTITATATGGAAPYAYSWSTTPIQTTTTATGLAPGTYTVTITDDSGCTQTTTATITEAATAVSGTTVAANASCFGGSNGTIDLTPSGGTLPYTFLWNDGATTEDKTTLTAGTYNCTITDANGCTATVSAAVTQPSAITGLAAVSQTNVSCNGGSNGAISVTTATGGTGTITYDWTPGTPTGDGTTSVTGLTAGTYTVTATDNNGCTKSSVFIIIEPVAIAGLTAVSQTNVSCNGGSNGSASVDPATGGTGTITYDWTPGTPTGDGTTSVTGLSAGSYTVTATDDNGCTKSSVFTIIEPAMALSGSATVTNVSCNAGSNGIINLTPSGGTTPYTFLWNNGVTTTEDRTALSAGIYSVTITDDNGCTHVVDNIVVAQPTAPVSGTTAVTDTSCFNGSNGTINITPSGGTGPYTFLWNDSVTTTEERTALSAGTYSVTITDDNGCTYLVDNIVVAQPTAPVSGTTIVTDTSCFGGSNGAINITPSGGTGTYTFLWNNGITTTEDRTALTAGTYSVIITDDNGCMGTVNNIVVGTPTAAVSGTTVVNDTSCFGGSNGAINLTPSGGTGPYTFLWNNGVTTTEDRTALSAGTYSVTITDANGCSATVSATVTQPSPFVITTSQTDILCNGSTTGSATVTVSGGTGAYTYLWSPSGGTAATASGLAAGTYTVTISDANNCQTTRMFTIIQPSPLVVTQGPVIDVNCRGEATGSATVYVTGSTSIYTYLWSNGDTNQTATGLAAGNYVVTVKDSNLCETTQSFTIMQPAAILSATTASTAVSCFGGSNGTASVNVSGGTIGYTYLWAPLGGTNASISGRPAGNYTCTITDSKGCALVKNITISTPAAISATTTKTDVSCNGESNGMATVAVSGGIAPYSYSWSPSGETGETVSGLAAGTYTVTITDSNYCQITQFVTITQPAVLAATTTQVNVLCNGGTGSATVTPTGGTTNYTYSWNTLPVQTTATATNLVAGAYNVIVTDANGCTVTKSVTITEPTVLAATTTQVNVLCNGGTGSATVTPTGGTTGYTYLWNTTPEQTSATATNLVAGAYNVIVTDANGCTVTKSVTITEPTVLAATTTQVNVLCNGGTGSATVTPTGGTTTYTYLWNTTPVQTAATATNLLAGTYNVVVTDANGCTVTKSVTITQPTVLAATTTQVNVLCNGGTGSATVTPTGGTTGYTYLWNTTPEQTSATATNLVAGAYNVIVTDANGCTVTKSVTITEPTVLAATTTQVNVLCNGGTGSATVTPTGGTTTYTYLWNTTPVQTAATATNLLAGTYNVVVTDANGCTVTKSVTITQPTVLAATTTQVNVLCNGGTGSATVTTTGGTTGYTYLWNTTPEQTSATATNLVAGAYNVIVTDANGCTVTKSVTITEPTVLAATTTQVNVLCNGGTGSATVTPTGGTTTYTYLWNTTPVQTAATATNLLAGTYNVVVTDANGCSVSEEITILQPEVLSSITSHSDALCNDASNGSAEIIISGGTAPYTYLWSNGNATAVASDLTAGTYSVVVTDANGCSVSEEIVIIEPLAILIDLQPVDVSTTTGNTAQFIAMAANADTYQWFVSEDDNNWTAINDGGTEPVYSGTATNTLALENVPVSFNGYLYKLQLMNGTDCSTSTDVAILTVSNVLEAVNDDFSTNPILEGTEAIAGDVTANDLYNNLPVSDSDVTITVIDNGGLVGVTIDADGNLTVPATGTAGTYIIKYQICDMISANNCTTAQAIVVIAQVAEIHQVKEIRFIVYPNPASTLVFIKLSDFAANSNIKATLYDLNGRLVRENNVSSETFSIDVSGLESAVYILNITSDTAIATKRIVVDKKP